MCGNFVTSKSFCFPVFTGVPSGTIGINVNIVAHMRTTIMSFGDVVRTHESFVALSERVGFIVVTLLKKKVIV